ncbi:IgGFc-binding protein [Sorangium sp. So ce590]|uniref:IgGFc-binding protein n=1 Tax=unclassified Sorangium TaxID=2621164 RepID=UPI003F5EF629
MANIVRYRRHAIVGVFAAAAGVTGSFAACSDSYRGELTGSGSGPGGAGTTGTGGAGGEAGGSTGTFGQGGQCEATCSNDLKKVISCNGAELHACGPEEGCVNAECIPDPCEAARRSKSSYGCDYWALKTAMVNNGSGTCFASFVANTWEMPVRITVEYQGNELTNPDLPSDFIFIPETQGATTTYRPYDPSAGLGVGEVAVLFLARNPFGGSTADDCPDPAVAAIQDEVGVRGTGRGSAFHISTDYPVVAYQMAPFSSSGVALSSATLLIPTSAWDDNYVAINAYGYSGAPAYGSPSLDIVAYEDDTEVTLLPRVAIEEGDNVVGSEANEPVTYTLGVGEFLQITQQAELTGSPIASTKPVGVFGGHECMKVPDDVNDCDAAQQQIAPVRATGNEYVGVRYRGRGGNDDEAPPWRIVGMVDDTELTWIPSAPEGAPTAIKSGETYQFNASGPFTVKSQSSNNPFYLGAYMTGGVPFGREGDPEWVNVVPPIQFLDYYVFFTDPNFPETSLVVVRTPSKRDGSFADVELDCAGPLTGWEDIDGYQYTRVNIVSGNFEGFADCSNGRREMISELPFGVTVWGWGAIQNHQLVSYAYPAGAGFQPINEVVVPPTVQ